MTASGLVVRVPGYRSRGFGSDFRHYHIFNVVDLSLVSSGGPFCWPRNTLFRKKLVLTSPTSGGSSVGIGRSRTDATSLLLFDEKQYCGPQNVSFPVHNSCWSGEVHLTPHPKPQISVTNLVAFQATLISSSRWRHQIPPYRRYPPTRQHGVTQKTAVWTVVLLYCGP
jgi:hypothetical protein